jgi:hypothetical protein
VEDVTATQQGDRISGFRVLKSGGRIVPRAGLAKANILVALLTGNRILAVPAVRALSGVIASDLSKNRVVARFAASAAV